MREHYDPESVAAFANGTGELVTYDDKERVTRKAEFAMQHNLAGIPYWHLAKDKQGKESLVRAGHEAQKKSI